MRETPAGGDRVSAKQSTFSAAPLSNSGAAGPLFRVRPCAPLSSSSSSTACVLVLCYTNAAVVGGGSNTAAAAAADSDSRSLSRRQSVAEAAAGASDVSEGWIGASGIWPGSDEAAPASFMSTEMQLENYNSNWRDRH